MTNQNIDILLGKSNNFCQTIMIKIPKINKKAYIVEEAILFLEDFFKVMDFNNDLFQFQQVFYGNFQMELCIKLVLNECKAANLSAKETETLFLQKDFWRKEWGLKIVEVNQKQNKKLEYLTLLFNIHDNPQEGKYDGYRELTMLANFFEYLEYFNFFDEYNLRFYITYFQVFPSIIQPHRFIEFTRSDQSIKASDFQIKISKCNTHQDTNNKDNEIEFKNIFICLQDYFEEIISAMLQEDCEKNFKPKLIQTQRNYANSMNLSYYDKSYSQQQFKSFCSRYR